MFYRPEASSDSATPWLGGLSLTRSIPTWISVGTAICLAAALISYSMFGSYTDKARVSGILVSQGGEFNVMAPAGGRIVELPVKEGQIVDAGELLVVIDTDRATESSNGIQDTTLLILEQIENRRAALTSQKQSMENLARLQKQTIESQLRSLDNELLKIEDEIALQQRRRDIAATTLQRYERLVESEFVSSIQVQQQQEALIDQDARLKSLERDLVRCRKDREAAAMELQQVDIRLATDVAMLDRDIATLNQERTENTARHSTSITAPRPGMVSALTITAGQTVVAGQTLVAIQPKSSRLEAHLYAPTRTAGFIKEGQKVLVRYAAFPYQKFGLFDGRISSVSKSAFAPNDLPPSLQVLFGRQSIPEALYRVTVALTAQDVAAFGQRYPLRPGMALEADIVQERRTIIEWLFEPLFAFSKRT